MTCDQVVTIIGMLVAAASGGAISYFFNLKLQTIKEKKDKLKEEEENKKQQFRNLKTTLLSLERNARQLSVCKMLLTEHKRENASNIVSPYLDNKAYHHELVDFIDPHEINHLYVIESSFKEISSRIEFINEIRKETLKLLFISNTVEKKSHYLFFENKLNKEIISIIDPLLIHIKLFCTKMEEYAKDEFPAEKVYPINWDFI